MILLNNYNINNQMDYHYILIMTNNILTKIILTLNILLI